VTPTAWRYYKAQRARLGRARALKGRRVVKEELRMVSLEEREMIYPLLEAHPSWDARQLAHELARQSQGAVRLEPSVIADDLERLKLDTQERRERFARRRTEAQPRLALPGLAAGSREMEAQATEEGQE
jgi:hypothetical protein